MGLEITDLNLLFYLLPGFLVYAIVSRLINSEKEKDFFETTFLSIFLSVIIYAILAFLNSRNLTSFESPDWRLWSWLVLIIFSISALAIIFIKWILPKLERFTQSFDLYKSSAKDILSDILEELKQTSLDNVKKYGIWLCICTKENKIYSGFLKRQGLFNEKKKGIYLKNVIHMNGKSKEYNVNEFDGVLFLEDEIRWISIIKYNFKPPTRRKVKI